MAIAAANGRDIRVKREEIFKGNAQSLSNRPHAFTLLSAYALGPFNELHVSNKLNGNMRCIRQLFVRTNSLVVTHDKREVRHRLANENVRPADWAI